MIFQWSELQEAWEFMLPPNQQGDVKDTIEAIRGVYLSHSGRVALIQLLFATFWLMDSQSSERD